MERFWSGYQHILQIDQHRPGQTPPSVSSGQIEPRYLTHELSSRGRMARAEAERTDKIITAGRTDASV